MSEQDVQPGDIILITTKDTKEQGILIPSPHDGVLIIKLKNGYNMGFRKNDVENIELIETRKETINKPIPITTNSDLPTISILHTGGTIASKADYRTGGVVSDFTPEQLVSLFPELKNIANIKSELISQMWSDDLRFAHFSLIATKIKEHVEAGSKGIIIGIGTDNLAVASAALSFMIEQTPVPIVLVGAQRSSDRGSSDAAMNLICAARFVTSTDFGGVAICMHATSSDTTCVILSASKTYKLHSSRRDAFKAVNKDAIAHVNYKTGTITFTSSEYPTKSDGIKIKPDMEDKVALIKVHVNMQPEQFEFYKGYKGLIIEGTGLGHTPGQAPNDLCKIHEKMYPAIKDVIDSGCVVVMTTQCIFGGVNLNVYDKGRDLRNIGVISGEDMLGNTALVKLSWLLANFDVDEAKRLIGKNLRGEINATISYKE